MPILHRSANLDCKSEWGSVAHEQGSNTLKNADPEQVREDFYRAASPAIRGRSGAALKRFAGTLSPGRALELAYGKDDDAVWLAQQGWHVVDSTKIWRMLRMVSFGVERALAM